MMPTLPRPVDARFKLLRVIRSAFQPCPGGVDTGSARGDGIGSLANGPTQAFVLERYNENPISFVERRIALTNCHVAQRVSQ
jgi:hypothetical protein